MSWQTDVITTIRTLIGDLDGAKYTDTRLLTISIIASTYVNKEVSFDSIYTISISDLEITPTPESDFIALLSLKAASIILNAEAKIAGENSVKVVDGPSSIDLASSYTALKGSAKTADDDYQSAKLSHQHGNLKGGRIILTPYTTPFNTVGENFS
jgi:hypothetical protein